MFLKLFGYVILILQVLLFVSLIYHYILLLAGIRRSSDCDMTVLPRSSFAVLIPAHNEESVIGNTVRHVKALDYPLHLFDIYVIADHCDDKTAELARANGAHCLERQEGTRGRKAYALQWGLEKIRSLNKPYDAYLVIDADSQLDTGFLQAMDEGLHRGYPVLQGQHVIANPTDSHFAGLADMDMRLNNLLRNQAKRNLRLSGRLMGDAMCFASRVIREYGWPTDSLTEDREYGVYLAMRGIRTIYVPSAISYGQAVSRWGDATKQRLRWYGGNRQMRFRLGQQLLRSITGRMGLCALDHLMELFLPPISLATLLSCPIALGQLIFPDLPWVLPFPLSALLAILWAVFPILGLWAAHAPAAVFRSLAYGPPYLLWRVTIAVKVRLGLGRIEWVRTRRREELP